MRFSVKALAIGLVFIVSAGGAPLPAESASSLVLERVVVVERHGVRSPTKSPEILSKYSAEPWPAWPVPVGELTAHGAADIRLMGSWLRGHYAQAGLWPAKGCPASGDAFAWADGADQRTRASGDALLEGAFPGCGLTANHGPLGELDPLFDGVSSGICPIDADAARRAVVARAHGDLDAPGSGYQAAKTSLWEILVPSAVRKPCQDTQGVCVLGGHNTLSLKGGELRMDGPLATASTLTESLLLEYAEGMPASAVGWGRADSVAKIGAVMPLHRIDSDLMRRTPYLATRNGGLLARAVIDSVDGRSTLPGQGEAGRKLVVIAGHDTNLSNLAGVLGVDWRLEGQPDDTPPGAALVFEVWRNPVTSTRTVRVSLVYQTLEQLRAATPLTETTPPGRVALSLPACADAPGGACSVEKFRQSVESVIPQTCRRPE
jgi:4-phytase/acid phosphatase